MKSIPKGLIMKQNYIKPNKILCLFSFTVIAYMKEYIGK